MMTDGKTLAPWALTLENDHYTDGVGLGKAWKNFRDILSSFVTFFKSSKITVKRRYPVRQRLSSNPQWISPKNSCFLFPPRATKKVAKICIESLPLIMVSQPTDFHCGSFIICVTESKISNIDAINVSKQHIKSSSEFHFSWQKNSQRR